jgi:pimeloyl-ACP methyl ester carboxylesterase
MSETPAILTRDEGATIAYHRRSGKTPGIVFLGGFNSDMTGAKAQALDAFCAGTGRAFLRFDYFAHGASSGDFAEATIGRFLDDTLAVIDRLTEGKLVLVGSSIGGWLMLLAARERLERIHALVGIAAAPDATEDLMWQRLPFDAREALIAQGSVRIPSKYSAAGYLITRKLIEEARARLVLRTPLDLRCPIRLLHGMADPDVPWQTSLALIEHVAGSDVRVTLIKDGDHRLSRPSDLELLLQTLKSLLD